MTCNHCQSESSRVVLHGTELWCSSCHYGSQPLPFGQAPGVIADDIPGGVLMHHGICNEDGTPKRYYSKTDIRRAAFEKNLFNLGDTPKVNPRIEDAKASGAIKPETGIPIRGVDY